MSNKVGGFAFGLFAVFAFLLVPLLGIVMMIFHVLMGCVIGHVAEWAFGDTLRPALENMFGWTIPLSHVGAVFGFVYSWLAALAITSSAANSAK